MLFLVIQATLKILKWIPHGRWMLRSAGNGTWNPHRRTHLTGTDLEAMKHSPLKNGHVGGNHYRILEE